MSDATIGTMRAVVLRATGGPELLRVEQVPIPLPHPGQIRIRVKAFGVNRSETYMRSGLYPIPLPRILGIEAVGMVDSAPGGEFAPGTLVATAMGQMGRAMDGGYADYVVVSAGNVQSLVTQLPWEMLGGLPEMLQTAWGSLFESLLLEEGQTLLVRGGTTSVGMAAAAIAKRHGAVVLSTTRNAAREASLLAGGVDRVFIDDGAVGDRVLAAYPAGVDKVLEMVGVTTLADSMRCVAERGVLCLTGMAGNAMQFDTFDPMGVIPTSRCLTTYQGEAAEFMATPLQELVDAVAAGTLQLPKTRVFAMEDIAEAHRLIESNGVGGKIVVLT